MRTIHKLCECVENWPGYETGREWGRVVLVSECGQLSIQHPQAEH